MMYFFVFLQHFGDFFQQSIENIFPEVMKQMLMGAEVELCPSCPMQTWAPIQTGAKERGAPRKPFQVGSLQPEEPKAEFQ